MKLTLCVTYINYIIIETPFFFASCFSIDIIVSFSYTFSFSCVLSVSFSFFIHISCERFCRTQYQASIFCFCFMIMVNISDKYAKSTVFIHWNSISVKYKHSLLFTQLVSLYEWDFWFWIWRIKKTENNLMNFINIGLFF